MGARLVMISALACTSAVATMCARLVMISTWACTSAVATAIVWVCPCRRCVGVTVIVPGRMGVDRAVVDTSHAGSMSVTIVNILLIVVVIVVSAIVIACNILYNSATMGDMACTIAKMTGVRTRCSRAGGDAITTPQHQSLIHGTRSTAFIMAHRGTSATLLWGSGFSSDRLQCRHEHSLVLQHAISNICITGTFQPTSRELTMAHPVAACTLVAMCGAASSS